jgi:hypothetical protein
MVVPFIWNKMPLLFRFSEPPKYAAPAFPNPPLLIRLPVVVEVDAVVDVMLTTPADEIPRLVPPPFALNVRPLPEVATSASKPPAGP